jgi:hypothetical protein
MKTEPPPQRRKFAGARDEMDYLYHKLLYWLYERQDRARARAFGKRLARLLSRVSPAHDAIFPEECRSLICEASEDLQGAIAHRASEIRLIKRLHETSRHTPQEEEVFGLYGYDDLRDRLDLLATLYHDSGAVDQALAVLGESKQLCEEQGVAFDGDDILQECLDEKRKSRDHSEEPSGARKKRTAS